jgi:hypothetical protein
MTENHRIYAMEQTARYSTPTYYICFKDNTCIVELSLTRARVQYNTIFEMLVPLNVVSA